MAWYHDGETLLVSFNRDESTSRAIAEKPATYGGTTSRFIAPRDPVGSGTWLAVSDRGSVFALLNNYDAGTPTRPEKSRGALVWDLAGNGDRSVIDFTDDSCRPFAPFHQFAFNPTLQLAQQTSWDGQHAKTQQLSLIEGFFTTSSLDCARVTALRHQAFESFWSTAGERDSNSVQGFLNGEIEALDPTVSVMMDRGDRRTISQSQISIGKSSASFQYRECHEPTKGAWSIEELAIEACSSEAIQRSK